VNVRLIINALCKFWDQLWTIISILKRRYTIEQLQTSRLRKFPETKASRGDFIRKALSLKTSEEWQNKSTLKQKKSSFLLDFFVCSFCTLSRVHYPLSLSNSVFVALSHTSHYSRNSSLVIMNSNNASLISSLRTSSAKTTTTRTWIQCFVQGLVKCECENVSLRSKWIANVRWITNACKYKNRLSQFWQTLGKRKRKNRLNWIVISSFALLSAFYGTGENLF